MDEAHGCVGRHSVCSHAQAFMSGVNEGDSKRRMEW